MGFFISFNMILSTTEIQYLLTFTSVILFFVIRHFIIQLINKADIKKKGNKAAHRKYIQKILLAGLFSVILAINCIIWEISFHGLSFYFASFFTVAGVALFANWSVLSNFTASVILFFNYSINIGDEIKIVDGDKFIEGTVEDITLFYIQLSTEDDKIVNYPNNLALQRPIYIKSNFSHD